jgi:hypothetical protein
MSVAPFELKIHKYLTKGDDMGIHETISAVEVSEWLSCGHRVYVPYRGNY